jgi:predicted TPR repeat methyltransferase
MIQKLISQTKRFIYAIPHAGVRFYGLVEFCRGKRHHQDRDYWNDSLAGWASSYLGGTLSIDLRNSVTVLLARQVAPEARSVLDLGCAGATLARHLGPEVDFYCGVDISDVAISKGRENLAESNRSRAVTHLLEVSTVQDYQPSCRFDVIVFNEVMYYLTLRQIKDSIRRYAGFLSPGGVILVSLKDHEMCRCVQAVILEDLRFEHAVLYQEQPARRGWKTVQNRESPAFLIQAFRPREGGK